MKTVAKVIMTALFMSLTTLNVYAVEVNQNTSKQSVGDCTRYKHLTAQELCVEMVEIANEIENYPVRMNIAKQKFTDAQNLGKDILSAIDTHLNVSKLATHPNPAVRKRFQRYANFDLGKKLIQYKQVSSTILQTVEEEMRKAEVDVEAITPLKIIYDGIKKQIDIVEKMEGR